MRQGFAHFGVKLKNFFVQMVFISHKYLFAEFRIYDILQVYEIKDSLSNFSAAHFAKRNTKFGGDGKIGIGKRGRAKIPSPQPPSFLPARAFSFCRAKRGNQSEFRSK